MRYILILTLLTGLLSCTPENVPVATSPDPAPELVRLSHHSMATEKERDFYVYLPRGYRQDTSRKWPVILFLHGNGERGNGKEELNYVLHHGPLYEAWIQKRELPFIIIVPQLPMYGQDTLISYIKNRDPGRIPERLETGTPPRPDAFPTQGPMDGQPAGNNAYPWPETGPPYGWHLLTEDLQDQLDLVSNRFRADTNRIYLTGISYGGFGTWYVASRYPERFAAICPVVGCGHPNLMEPIARAQLPVWAFAGGRDPLMRPEYFYEGLNKLEQLGHPEVRFTVHEDRAHDAWKRVYAGEDVYTWLLQHYKK